MKTLLAILLVGVSLTACVSNPPAPPAPEGANNGPTSDEIQDRSTEEIGGRR